MIDTSGNTTVTADDGATSQPVDDDTDAVGNPFDVVSDDEDSTDSLVETSGSGGGGGGAPGPVLLILMMILSTRMLRARASFR